MKIEPVYTPHGKEILLPVFKTDSLNIDNDKKLFIGFADKLNIDFDIEINDLSQVALRSHKTEREIIFCRVRSTSWEVLYVPVYPDDELRIPGWKFCLQMHS